MALVATYVDAANAANAADDNGADADAAEVAVFEWAYVVRRPPVTKFLVHCLRFPDPELIADIYQQTMLQAWRKRHTIEPPYALAWLITTAKNALYDVLRHQFHHRAPILVIWPANEGALDHPDVLAGERMSLAARWLAIADSDPHHQPEEALQQREERRYVHQLLRTLPAPDAQILLLHYIQAVPIRAIAALLGVPPGTVKPRLRRARQLAAANAKTLDLAPGILDAPANTTTADAL